MDTTWIATHSDGTACDRATTTHDCPANHRYTHTEWLERGAMDDITYAYAALDGLSASGDRVRLAYTLNGRGRKLDPMSAGDARIALDALIDTASVLGLPLPTSITVYRVEDAMGVL